MTLHGLCLRESSRPVSTFYIYLFSQENSRILFVLGAEDVLVESVHALLCGAESRTTVTGGMRQQDEVMVCCQDQVLHWFIYSKLLAFMQASVKKSSSLNPVLMSKCLIFVLS